MPSLSLEEKPQLAYPPPDGTPEDFASPTSIPLPSSTQTPTPIVLENGWYLYKDPDNEFSFAYPPTAIVTFGKNPVDLSKNINIQFLLQDKPYQGMTLRLESNPGLLSGAEIAIKVLEESSGKIASMEFKDTLGNIMVGEKPAVQATIPETNTETTIIVPLGEKFMIIAPIHDTAVIKVEPEILQMFYQIVDSVQFPLENGWYLYEDKEAGYSFSYPPDVFFHTSQEGGLEFRTARIQFTRLKDQGYQGMVVDVLSNPNNQSIDKIIQEMYSTPILNLSLETINATVNKISVAEFPAYLTTYQPFMFELCIFVPYRDKILFIVPVHDNLDNTVSPEALKVFWDIVKTFKIKS